jgi:hypothetical protein
MRIVSDMESRFVEMFSEIDKSRSLKGGTKNLFPELSGPTDHAISFCTHSMAIFIAL